MSPTSTLSPAEAHLVRALESRCFNAWPALEERALGGWRLRYGRGYTRRANSVQPLEPPSAAPAEALADCEAAYAAWGLPCVFKLTPLTEPAGLAALLDERGYGDEGHTSVQEGPIAGPLPGGGPEVRLLPVEDSGWLEAFFRMDATPTSHQGTMAELLARIPATPGVTHTGAVIEREGRVVCCGRAVAEDGRVGLFDLVTDPAFRGQGLGTALMAALLDWGRRQGATASYLQVERDNTPALRLYQRLGFRERYGYHYRVQQPR